MNLFDFFRRRPSPAGPCPRRPRLECLEERTVPYTATGNAWPAPQLVTISFVPDGTLVSNDASGGGVGSNLFSKLNAKFGSAAAWQNIVLRAAQSFAAQTNVNFQVVPDDGSDLGSGLYQQGDPDKGDIRIGGYVFGTTHLATAYSPPPVNNYSIAGDFVFNTGVTFNNGTTYDLFTVAAHEIGHSLGLGHTHVVSAEMYSVYNGAKPNLVTDDINGIRSVYSAGAARSADAYDAAASNGSFAAATNLTAALTADPTLLVAADQTTTADADYYKIVAPASGTLTVNLQSSGLSLLAPSLKLYSAGYALLGSASNAGTTGATVTASIPVTAGTTYYVLADGAVTTAFGTGAYSLNFGLNATPLVAASPNTTLANGAPLQGGGGLALVASADSDSLESGNYARRHPATTPRPAVVASAPRYAGFSGLITGPLRSAALSAGGGQKLVSPAPVKVADTSGGAKKVGPARQRPAFLANDDS